jgi:hypothetical protein
MEAVINILDALYSHPLGESIAAELYEGSMSFMIDQASQNL